MARGLDGLAKGGTNYLVTISLGSAAMSHFGTDADFSDMNPDDDALPHEHCQCVHELQKSIKTLRSELSASRLKTHHLRSNFGKRRTEKILV